MGIRSTVGSVLESAIGRERTNTIRKVERKARNALAKRLAMEPPKKAGREARQQTGCSQAKVDQPRPSGWQPPDPFVPTRSRG